jgi:hypothetical protein
MSKLEVKDGNCYTTVKISHKNIEHLRALGSFGDTYDQVITKVHTYAPNPKIVKEDRIK